MHVDHESLQLVSSDLSSAGEGVVTIAGEVESVGEAEDADLQIGLGALTVAWGAAVQVLGEDIAFLSSQVNIAAGIYDDKDRETAEQIYTPTSREGPR